MSRISQSHQHFQIDLILRLSVTVMNCGGRETGVTYLLLFILLITNQKISDRAVPVYLPGSDAQGLTLKLLRHIVFAWNFISKCLINIIHRVSRKISIGLSVLLLLQKNLLYLLQLCNHRVELRLRLRGTLSPAYHRTVVLCVYSAP